MTSGAKSRLWTAAPFVPIVALCAYALMGGGQFQAQILDLRTWYLTTFDHFTLYLSLACVVICAGLALGPWRRVRLGGPGATPEFGTVSWLAMLFAAGMGSGIVFWGVAEPLIFFSSPPIEGLTEDGERKALAFSLTLFHWTIHPWSIYAIAALAMGIVGRSKLDLHTPGASFPWLNDTARRWIDWLAIYSVIFGVVATMGQGSLLIATGIQDYRGGPASGVPTVAVTVCALITVCFVISSASGLKRGIKLLSNTNMMLAFILLGFVLIAGPAREIFSDLGPALGRYVQDFLSLSLEMEDGPLPVDWKREWSIIYLLWWIAWTPFVGAFIARISHGRTLLEFAWGVILAPTAMTIAWFLTFGGAGIAVQALGTDLGIASFEDAPLAAYRLLAEFPATAITQAALMLLMAFFLITSGDSGSYVLGVFSAHRTGEPPLTHKLLWGAVIGLLGCAAVMSPGIQDTNRAFAVLGAIPLSFLMLYQCGFVVLRVAQLYRADRKGAQDAQGQKSHTP